jgi:hypothetical protein
VQSFWELGLTHETFMAGPPGLTHETLWWDLHG